MEIKRFVCGELRSNCYIIREDAHCLVIDPGENPDEILNYLTTHNLIIDAIYITHGHRDHVAGVKPLTNTYQTTVYAPKKDAEWLIESPLNRLGYPIPIDVWVSEGDEIEAINRRFKVYETPGHSEGGTVLSLGNILFSGDTLFYQSIGRTDIPRSNSMEIYQSIKRMYHLFADDTIVYPGHGRDTTIGHEKLFNPFVRK